MAPNRLSLKLLVGIGTCFLIPGFLLFLKSLGHGGAFFASSLIVVGAVLIVLTVILGMIRMLAASRRGYR